MDNAPAHGGTAVYAAKEAVQNLGLQSKDLQAAAKRCARLNTMALSGMKTTSGFCRRITLDHILTTLALPVRQEKSAARWDRQGSETA